MSDRSIKDIVYMVNKISEQEIEVLRRDWYTAHKPMKKADTAAYTIAVMKYVLMKHGKMWRT